ncbi:PAS domain S-box protein [Acidobacteria bacterium AB60]|nr:PAS domain S-box protein [Acidobacteria bacterium AB60]
MSNSIAQDVPSAGGPALPQNGHPVLAEAPPPQTIEDRLRQSEQRLQMVLEGAQLGAWYYDPQRQFVVGDARMRELFPGVSGEAPAEDWIACIVPEDRDRVAAAFQAAVDRGISYDIEFRVNTPSGPRWEHSIGRTFQRDGRSYILGVTSDIHERKQIELERELQAERLRLIYAGAKVGTWVWEFSDGRCETYGTTDALWGRNDLKTGEDFINAVHPDDRSSVIRQVERALADPQATYAAEFRVVWPDGTVRWISAPGTVFRDSEGRPVRMAGINRDITAQKQAELALAETNRELQLAAERVQLALAAIRDSEARHRLFVENAPASIAMFDREMRYIAVSRRWLADRRISGDILGRSHYDVFPDLPQHWREVHRRGLEGESLSTEREQMIRGDGTTHWIKWELHPWYEASGAIGGIMLATEDVTAAVLAEEALRKNEKLAVVGRLAATISHEINNPLEAVFNLIYLCRGMDLPDQAAALLSQAEAELKRVSHVVTHTLVFNRQSTRETSEKTSTLVDSALAIYEGRLKQAEIRVLARSLDHRRVLCISSELRQVFANLIGNAFDAMNRGGTLFVRTRDLRHPQTAAPGVCVTVADTGLGMDPDTVRRLCEPFFTTKGMHGTGLGLWVSRDILRKHAGYLRVRSRKGVGSVFSVWLPAAG